MTEQHDTAELVKWLRLYARGLQISGEPTHGNDEGLNLAADRLEALESRQRVLSEIASNADRAMRFVKLVASQRLSDAANAWYADEFGEEGEPDFEGAYDSFIEQARCILNDSARALAGDAP